MPKRIAVVLAAFVVFASLGRAKAQSLPPPVVSANSLGTTFELGGPAVAVDPALTVSSFDSDITGATETIRSPQPGDVLHFTPQQGISGFFSSDVLTLFGSATPAQYQFALESVTFSATSGIGTRDIAITASDSAASPQSGNTAAVAVAVTPEPASAVMMALGAIGLLTLMRKTQCLRFGHQAARRSVTVLFSVLAIAVACPGRADATFTEATSVAQLNATDSVDWGQLGAPFTLVSNPVSVTSDLGTTLTVSQTQAAEFSPRVEGAEGGWIGDFLPGDHLIWTDVDNNNPNEIDIATPGLYAAGAQIEPDWAGAFVARVTAYDAAGNVLASFTEGGVSNQFEGGTATFLGIVSTTPFARVGFSLDSAFADVGSFAIDTFYFATVPEPSSVVLLTIGTIALLAVARCRKG